MKRSLPPTLTVVVSPRDINTGEVQDCRSCPIARASNRALREAGFLNNPAAVCDMLDVHARRTDELVGSYNLPDVAKAFITQFDQGSTAVAPFTFVATLRG